MRELVGPTDPAAFDNPDGSFVVPDLDASYFEAVFDWGCGCGRLARQLIQQRTRPRRYVGVDLHRGMIEWCRRNLEPHAPGFQFFHHDVYEMAFNPGPEKARWLPFPVEDASFSLAIAWSVFTHVSQEHATEYLREMRRILRPTGMLVSTWFLFDKGDFPMMQDFQNALFINDINPTNAVIFDKAWLRETLHAVGLDLVGAVPPAIRGYQWTLRLAPAEAGLPEVDLPDDATTRGRVPPPTHSTTAHLLGLEETSS
jgi:SAM-dependent methyltransferase